MKTIRAKNLNCNDFKKYGDFYNLLDPQGYSLGDFFPDRLLSFSASNSQTAYSPLIIRKQEENIIEKVEHHNYATEILLPLDGDMVVHVAPPSVDLVPEETEAFIVPKGTLIKLNVGVWHLAPFAIKEGITHVLVVLPERTYNNDCVIKEYKEKIKVLV